jgi:S-adenosylmethionine synthetase
LAIQFVKKEKVDKCLVEIAWVIGKPEPLYIKVNGEQKCLNTQGRLITVTSIIEQLKLREPIFKETSILGHFGSDFNWEK